jgi:UPF0176 protein
MALLHNRVSQKELKQRLLQETEVRETVSFYKYFSIPDTQSFRDKLYISLNALNVFGRIYIAPEGINAQLSVPHSRFGDLQNYIHSLEDLKGIRLNVSPLSNTGDQTNSKSFWVLKIKVRAKIVADGLDESEFFMREKGHYVNAEAFNDLTANPDTIVVDMRNHYEYEVGHFENALEVPSDTFREQLPMAVEMLQHAKDQNIIMYCTGGIRCEKASAYMLHHGFKKVFHLEGGIINYFNQVQEKELTNKFIGKNFVFDNRLGERITNQIIAKCHQCELPADTHVNCANEACHLLFIQCESCADKYDGCCSHDCQQVFKMPPEIQKELRKGINKGSNIFNKSRKLKPGIDIR